MDADGGNVPLIKEKMNDILIKTVLSILPDL